MPTAGTGSVSRPVDGPATIAQTETPAPADRAADLAEPARAPAPADDDAPWPVDESTEAAFRAEALSRGETMAVPAAAEEPAEEAEPKGALPPLDALVQRIPAEVRETLEDLFRARFVSVKRVPKKALKK